MHKSLLRLSVVWGFCLSVLLLGLAAPASAQVGTAYIINSGGGAAPTYANLDDLRLALGVTGLLNGDSITFNNSDATLTGELTLAPGAALTLGNGGAPGTSLTISAASGATNRFLSVAGGATSTGAAA